jgi:predicted metal-dependent peptidase
VSSAIRKLSRARLQLMLRHPFLSAAMARLPMIESTDHNWCPTLATDGYNIYWNSEFCNGLADEHLLGVIAHELMHCLLGHNDRRGERNRILWNIAIDHATNLFLLDCNIALPGDRLADRRFSRLTAEKIYDQLLIQSSKRELEIGESGIDPSHSKNSKNAANSVSRLFAEGGFDAHIEEHDVEGASGRSQGFPTSAERRRIRKELGRSAKEKFRGVAPSNLIEEINSAGESRISWQSLLARFMSGIRKDDYRLYPFNRRHIWRELYLPSIGMPGPQHIITAIDTSGSMDGKILGKVLSELDALRARTQCKLTLIECDASVQNVSTYEGWELSNIDFTSRPLKGRGGTSFKPVFDWIDKNWYQNPPPPDALIYLTDGYASFPEFSPNYSVLWALPENSDQKPPFGQVLEVL